MVRPRELLAWQRQAIADAYGAGEKCEAIAAEFGVTSTYVSRIGREAGHPRRQIREKTRTVEENSSSVQLIGMKMPSAGDAR